MKLDNTNVDFILKKMVMDKVPLILQLNNLLLLLLNIQGKGRIFIINGNTISQTDYISPIKNMIFYYMSRNIKVNFKILLGDETKTYLF